MQIRRGTATDWPFMQKLGYEGIQNSISPWRKQGMKEGIRYREKLLKGLWTWIQQTNSVVFIAEEDAPVGYLVLYPGAHEELTGLAQGWVMDLAVLPQFRGKGVAKALLATAEEHCRSIHLDYLGLAVSSHNIKALQLYEKWGFAEERKLMVKLL